MLESQDEEYDAQTQVIQQRTHKKKARIEEQFRLEARYEKVEDSVNCQETKRDCAR
jgi:BMFP domain-containing protein YqiC